MPPYKSSLFCILSILHGHVVEFDECVSNPYCGNGQCVDFLNYYHCSCDAGYAGIDCTELKDECSSNPCLHGICEDGFDFYTCSCDGDARGALCDVVASTAGRALKIK